MFPPVIVTVMIDIRANRLSNRINLKSSGIVPVAILSSPEFDAPVQVNPETLTLAGASVKMVGKKNKLRCHTDDVNYDGLQDLVCNFLIEQVLIQPGDSTAVLEGETFDGTPIRGEDSVKIVPFKQGKKVR